MLEPNLIKFSSVILISPAKTCLPTKSSSIPAVGVSLLIAESADVTIHNHPPYPFPTHIFFHLTTSIPHPYLLSIGYKKVDTKVSFTYKHTFAFPSFLCYDISMTEQTQNKQGFQPGNTYGNRWQPGESGHPEGRPKDSITSELRKLSDQIGKDGIIGRQKLAQKLWDLAMFGKIDAIDKIIDRLDGKVADKHRLEGLEGANVQINFIPSGRLPENSPELLTEGEDET